jgi:hypothetical protein
MMQKNIHKEHVKSKAWNPDVYKKVNRLQEETSFINFLHQFKHNHDMRKKSVYYIEKPSSSIHVMEKIRKRNELVHRNLRRSLWRSIYDIDNEDVYKYILSESTIQPLLLIGYKHIRKLFPKERLSLSLNKDYDNNTSYLQLTIFTHESIEDSYVKLKNLGTKWWYNQSANMNGKMSITIEQV